MRVAQHAVDSRATSPEGCFPVPAVWLIGSSKGVYLMSGGSPPMEGDDSRVFAKGAGPDDADEIDIRGIRMLVFGSAEPGEVEVIEIPVDAAMAATVGEQFFLDVDDRYVTVL